MTQTLQVPNTRAVKIIGEQATGAETAVLVDSAGRVQVNSVSGAVTETNSAAIKTAVEKLATETAVGDGIMVRSDTAANMLVTDANGPAIKTAVEKVATETGVGTGLLVRQPTMGGVLVEQSYSYSHLAASGQVKATAGFLHGVTFNTPGTASVVTIYDNPAAAGTAIAIVTLVAGTTAPFALPFDVVCGTGIYINMSVAVDVTASYR